MVTGFFAAWFFNAVVYFKGFLKRKETMNNDGEGKGNRNLLSKV
jgi:hypothetical protein